jgi:glutathione S-transferase
MTYTLVAIKQSGSFATHVLLRELGVDFDIQWVEIGGDEIMALNPLGQVPVLMMGNGQTLMEGASIFITLAEAHPETNLLPSAYPERSEVLRWFGYCNATLLPAFFPAYYPERYHPNPLEAEAVQLAAAERLRFLLGAAELQLKNKRWLTGDQFSIADIYLGMFGSWFDDLNVDIAAEFPNYAAMLARYEARPSVVTARALE